MATTARSLSSSMNKSFRFFKTPTAGNGQKVNTTYTINKLSKLNRFVDYSEALSHEGVAWLYSAWICYRQQKMSIFSQQGRRQLMTMQEILNELDLYEVYYDIVSPNKVFVGFHGTSINSIPYIVPAMTKDLGNQKSYHSNPDPRNHSFHVANNANASFHYASLNGLGWLHADSDVNYHDDSVIMGCFISPNTIDLPNQHRPLMGHNYKKNCSVRRGDELLIPKEFFKELTCIPFFTVAGSKRMFPLVDNSTVHVDGKPHNFKVGIGLNRITE